MQTFLPYMSFHQSAECLDNKRLGKQRVECLQLLNALTGKSVGWVRHPACQMWYGYTKALALYGLAICDEWNARGHKDTVRAKILALLPEIVDADDLYNHELLYSPQINSPLRRSVQVKAPLKNGGHALVDEYDIPHWLGDPSFHRAHQSNLVRKDPEHYTPIFGDIPNDLPYIWPKNEIQ